MDTYTVGRRPGPNEQYCPSCVGLGREPLPSPVIGPGLVDLVYRFMRCFECNGTGIISKQPGIEGKDWHAGIQELRALDPYPGVDVDAFMREVRGDEEEDAT